MRLILLFALILAITGGIIYYFIPRESSEPQPPQVNVQPGTTDAEVEKGSQSDGTAAPAQTDNKAESKKTSEGTSPVAASGNGQSESSNPTAENPPENPEQQPEKKDNPASSDAPDNAADGNAQTAASPSGGAATPTEFPEKGKPWVGDPPSEQNTAPVAPTNDTATQAAHLASLYAGALGDDAETVQVRAGDNLSRIAVRKHTTVEALRHFNRLKSDNILIGKKLKLLPGPWQITVDKTLRELRLERSVNGEWQNYATFQVGLGRMDSTPEADFVISTRLRHPDWYAPDGRVLRYGDAENPLGECFLKLAKSGAPDKPLRGYGIHGTSDESTVGKNWSHGCVRMRNRDVELLYYLVPSGTPVKIVSGGTVQKSEK
jgi:LysM repeat protein